MPKRLDTTKKNKWAEAKKKAKKLTQSQKDKAKPVRR